MARLLTPKEILTLAAGAGVKRIAVENFLSSLDNALPMQGHLMNLEMDAASYKWNYATQSAIRAGIIIAYGEAR